MWPHVEQHHAMGQIDFKTLLATPSNTGTFCFYLEPFESTVDLFAATVVDLSCPGEMTGLRGNKFTSLELWIYRDLLGKIYCFACELLEF